MLYKIKMIFTIYEYNNMNIPIESESLRVFISYVDINSSKSKKS